MGRRDAVDDAAQVAVADDFAILAERDHRAVDEVDVVRGQRETERFAAQPYCMGLTFEFHGIKMPLSHFHYDRFDTPDDEEDGKFSLNFRTNPMGEVEGAEISLDEAAVTFTRRVPPALTTDAMLKTYAGT